MASVKVKSDIPKDIYEKMLKAMQEQLLFSAFPDVYEENGVLRFTEHSNPLEDAMFGTYTNNATSTHGTPPPPPFWADGIRWRQEVMREDIPASQQIIDCVATDVEEPSKALVVYDGTK